MDLDECLETYKAITLELIEKTKHGEDLEGLLAQRSKVINEIGNIDFSKEELKNKISDLLILELDSELQTLVKAEKIKTKKQIDALRKNREARKNYGKIQEKPNFFSARS